MTRKDFELIARTVATLDHTDPADAGPATTPRGLAATAFADALAGTNPRFDRARFLRACGV